MPSWQADMFERFVSEGISRAQFLRRGVVAAGAVAAGIGLLRPNGAAAANPAEPLPIPGGFDENFNIVPSDPFIHVLPPTIGFEMATITDFDGVIAAAEIQGTAQGSDGTEYTFDTDMRFMRGRYIGTDGLLRTASFGFV
jgi:hypothetical protein